MIVPEKAVRVYNGIIYDVYHLNQSLFTGDSKTFEYLKRRPAVQIFAATPRGIVLLQEEQPGQCTYISIPGGNVEDDDDILASAKRELLEETGLSSNDWVLWKKLGLGLNIEFETYYFIARDCEQTSIPSLDKGGERIEVRELPVKKFLTTLEHSNNVRNEVLKAMVISINHDQTQYDEWVNLIYPKGVK